MLARVQETLKRIDGVAKVHQQRVETLLAFVEPPAGLSRASPFEAMAALEMQRRHYPQMLKPLQKLVPLEKLELVERLRLRLLRLFERLARLPVEERIRQRAAFATEIQAVNDAWPQLFPELHASGLAHLELVSRKVLGDEWLVPAIQDANHETRIAMSNGKVRVISVASTLRRNGYRTDRVSPLVHYRLCPTVCRVCWGRVRDRLRMVAHAVGEPDAAPSVRQAILDLLAANSGVLETTKLHERVRALTGCRKTLFYDERKALVLDGLVRPERRGRGGGKSSLTRLA